MVRELDKERSCLGKNVLKGRKLPGSWGSRKCERRRTRRTEHGRALCFGKVTEVRILEGSV